MQRGAGLRDAAAGQIGADAAGQQERGERGEAAQVVQQDQLGAVCGTCDRRLCRPSSSGQECGELPEHEGVALAAPGGAAGGEGTVGGGDLFGGFSSVTLHYDGDS